jgi:hypothetical protein
MEETKRNHFDDRELKSISKMEIDQILTFLKHHSNYACQVIVSYLLSSHESHTISSVDSLISGLSIFNICDVIREVGNLLPDWKDVPNLNPQIAIQICHVLATAMSKNHEIKVIGSIGRSYEVSILDSTYFLVMKGRIEFHELITNWTQSLVQFGVTERYLLEDLFMYASMSKNPVIVNYYLTRAIKFGSDSECWTLCNLGSWPGVWNVIKDTPIADRLNNATMFSPSMLTLSKSSIQIHMENLADHYQSSLPRFPKTKTRDAKTLQILKFFFERAFTFAAGGTEQAVELEEIMHEEFELLADQIDGDVLVWTAPILNPYRTRYPIPKVKFQSHFDANGYRAFLEEPYLDESDHDYESNASLKHLTHYYNLAIKNRRDDWMQILVQFCQKRDLETVLLDLFLEASKMSVKRFQFLKRHLTNSKTGLAAAFHKNKIQFRMVASKKVLPNWQYHFDDGYWISYNEIEYDDHQYLFESKIIELIQEQKSWTS